MGQPITPDGGTFDATVELNGSLRHAEYALKESGLLDLPAIRESASTVRAREEAVTPEKVKETNEVVEEIRRKFRRKYPNGNKIDRPKKTTSEGARFLMRVLAPIIQCGSETKELVRDMLRHPTASRVFTDDGGKRMIISKGVVGKGGFSTVMRVVELPPNISGLYSEKRRHPQDEQSPTLNKPALTVPARAHPARMKGDGPQEEPPPFSFIAKVTSLTPDNLETAATVTAEPKKKAVTDETSSLDDRTRPAVRWDHERSKLPEVLAGTQANVGVVASTPLEFNRPNKTPPYILFQDDRAFAVRDLLAELRKNDAEAALSPQAAALIIRRLLEALAMHGALLAPADRIKRPLQQRPHIITHRDLKPGNALVGASGAMKLGDYGGALLEREKSEVLASAGTAEAKTKYTRVTGSGQIGTPGYMEDETVTTSKDAFSLAMTLIDLSCPQDVALQQRENVNNGQRPDVSVVPEELQPLLRALLSNTGDNWRIALRIAWELTKGYNDVVQNEEGKRVRRGLEKKANWKDRKFEQYVENVIAGRTVTTMPHSQLKAGNKRKYDHQGTTRSSLPIVSMDQMVQALEDYEPPTTFYQRNKGKILICILLPVVGMVLVGGAELAKYLSKGSDGPVVDKNRWPDDGHYAGTNYAKKMQASELPDTFLQNGSPIHIESSADGFEQRIFLKSLNNPENPIACEIDPRSVMKGYTVQGGEEQELRMIVTLLPPDISDDYFKHMKSLVGKNESSDYLRDAEGGADTEALGKKAHIILGSTPGSYIVYVQNTGICFVFSDGTVEMYGFKQNPDKERPGPTLLLHGAGDALRRWNAASGNPLEIVVSPGPVGSSIKNIQGIPKIDKKEAGEMFGTEEFESRERNWVLPEFPDTPLPKKTASLGAPFQAFPAFVSVSESGEMPSMRDIWKQEATHNESAAEAYALIAAAGDVSEEDIEAVSPLFEDYREAAPDLRPAIALHILFELARRIVNAYVGGY